MVLELQGHHECWPAPDASLGKLRPFHGESFQQPLLFSSLPLSLSLSLSLSHSLALLSDFPSLSLFFLFFLVQYSYGVLIQYTNRSRSEPINVYFLERKMSGVAEDSLSRYTAMQSWEDRGSRASSGNSMDHVDDQTCMIPKHPVGKLSKTPSTSSASTSTSTSSFRARVKQESLKKLHAGVAKNESSTSQLEGKVYASASNEACGLKLKFLSDRLSDCEEESDFWFEKWLDGSSSIQMRTKVQRASEEESDFWFDKWLGSSNKLQWYEKAQQSKCRYGKAFRRSSCTRAQEV